MTTRQGRIDETFEAIKRSVALFEEVRAQDKSAQRVVAAATLHTLAEILLSHVSEEGKKRGPRTKKEGR